MTASVIKDENVQPLKNSAQSFKESADNTVDDIRDTAIKAKRKVSEFIDTASDEITHTTKAVNVHIHEKPVQSTLIALGIGYVLGALLHR